MTRDDRFWTVIVALAFLVGFAGGLAGLTLWDRSVANDRDVFMEVYRFEDRSWDMQAPENVTIIQPKEVKE
jgi:hypothetical protein